jgi:hypothetical protein
MMEALHRVRRAIASRAESYTVGFSSRKGVFALISPSRAARYIPQATIDTANRPIWAVVVADSDATVAGDVISWDGLSLTVLKVVKRRYRSTLLFKLLIAH